MLTLSNPLLARLQVDPQFSAATGALSACNVQAFFSRDLVNAETGERTPQPWGPPVLVDCVAKAATTVTFTKDGIEYTLPYGAIAAGMAAAAEQERAAQ
jgi:hypothetical protein